ncbi:YdeI/OmpD-associated family protein [Cryobacterium sp. 10S3]|uniref:YdeI/OmpD-associated family protein n=1 Tax=Cryobacterium sp. 10S3 TaxID=3048582 RepID=UPI002AC8F5E7|nr:YdeI/OmpD-associated family protein [Cryobacterium sp. 10S3]MEB0285384.1 YdeI/OmpD-associated family protein [Cryobacterium sp. 10S3]WPX13363.1 YdeI/OmpD-associated family protein [Cryobacterium sp. 10S3]
MTERDAGGDQVPRIHPESVEEWRTWLVENHAVSTAVWLVFWRKAAGRPILAYEDAVLEALSVGWIDSKPARLDEHRTMLYFSPRKRGSAWARPNKLRIELLRREGRMLPAGEAVVAAAEADGSWTRLDEVENLTVPADLGAALDGIGGARAQWDAFPPSARRGILEWIVQAKTPATRQKRIDETAVLAGRRERANQWKPKPPADPAPAPD